MQQKWIEIHNRICENFTGIKNIDAKSFPAQKVMTKTASQTINR